MTDATPATATDATATPAAATATAKPAQTTESAERLARPLIRLAKAGGVATSYIDQVGTYVEIDDDVLVNVLAALGIDAGSDAAIMQSLARLERERDERLLPSHTIVVTAGKETSVTLHCTESEQPTATITLEDGTECRSDLGDILPSVSSTDQFLILPDDLPIGYHTLRVDTGERQDEATLLVAPERIPLPAAIEEHPRWGWMTQLYAERSHDSWGVGDYGDLRRLAADAGAKSGADFMLINPIHATAPVPPLEPSPYLPESRRFLNVTYIRPQDIPEYATLSADDRTAIGALHATVAAANDSAEPLDLNASWDAKRRALRIIFDQPRSAEREAAFQSFVAAAGPDLDAFATWCLAFEVWGAPWEADSWFKRYNRESPEVAALVRDHHDLFEFNRWLQWIADEQVTAAQTAAKDSGMALGLMLDMAVGVHMLGADAWWNPERFAVGSVTVGCPPDFYNQQGQDWGQPPFNPRYLADTGYRVYREMVHAIFEHAGAVRIDHVLGLFRLWWIPQGRGAKGGAYVAYDHEAMLAVLAIEATRANGVVVGEDLGTVPDYVRKVLADHGVLGTDVEWFSRVDDSATAGDPYAPPSTYRRQALASVTTHDLPPTAGYLEFEHVKIREELGLLASSADEFRASAEAERRAMLELLVSGGWLRVPVADAAGTVDATAAGTASDAAGTVDATSTTASGTYLSAADIAADVPAYEQQIVEAMHRMLTDTPSVLRQATLMDGVGQHRAVNQPGTSDQYPNWRIPLTDAAGHVMHTDEIFDNPRVRSLAAVMNGKA
ncbi:4-alpha-glucanotransferase [Bifidobacterium biavatii]|uniref:4-alpha-glucanotransferase n=1 Tax=Bifidobacterium biavatii DSM 23969 TaxID=1437608 RepID=A0A086ZNE0_9BIFI|nr:4-alpha-glucanotransferase [Bifidobacterium biavatii]KFI48040.1 amylomaltase, 4-alpha-glucanotransferase [Bifidobacterium biavatii DSM 23969]